MTQHDLMVRVLEDAGGKPVESMVPVGYRGKIADILFPDDDVIVEVKSLTTDRAADPKTGKAVGEMFSKNIHLGAPVFWGTRGFRLHDLDPRVAASTLRIVGQRVLAEAKAANKQIKATKEILAKPSALGVIALISPPFKLDRKSIAWLVNDAMREGRCSGIDVLFLVETTLDAPETRGNSNSFLAPYSRSGRQIPPHLLVAIDRSWGRITGQIGNRADSDDFHKYGATS
jgi:hypothetical protein